jgi:type II secretory pathway pseudopilin PulG
MLGKGYNWVSFGAVMEKRAGFTLISFILVVAIIGMLTVILFPAVADVGHKAKIGGVKADLRLLKNALEYYCLVYGVFPDLKQNEWEDPGKNLLLFVEKRLIDQLPEDPFNPGSGYQYKLHKAKKWYIVYTRGLNGNGSAKFNKDDPDRVIVRKGATAAYVTNARDVVLEP